MKCKGLFGSFLIVRTFTDIVGQVVGAWVGFTLAQSYKAKQQLPMQNEAASGMPNSMSTQPRTKTTYRTLHLHLDCFIDIVYCTYTMGRLWVPWSAVFSISLLETILKQSFVVVPNRVGTPNTLSWLRAIIINKIDMFTLCRDSRLLTQNGRQAFTLVQLRPS